MLKLGSLVLKSKVLLSPLEGVSDVGFRSLCATLGAGFTWTEMVRAQGITKNNAATLALIDTHDPNTPTGLQLMTKSGKELAEALQKLEDLAISHPEQYNHFQNIQAIDLNFGCPSKDIIRIGAGPALLKRKTKLREIFEVLYNWKKSQQQQQQGQSDSIFKNVKAVGIKIRLGLNVMEAEQVKVYLQVAEIANEIGLDYITIHGRHGQQRSSSPASWKEIREVKAMSKIPVIGNGDIWTKEDMIRMMEMTQCDGVMVARTAIRNPWIFRELSTVNMTNSHLNHSPSSGSSSSSSSLDDWPTIEEVKSAMSNYQSTSQKFQTKPKFVEFNTFNLNRIYNAVQSSNEIGSRGGSGSGSGGGERKKLEYIGPKNMHFS
jgi:tRNA-dihydrouridine synthase B